MMLDWKNYREQVLNTVAELAKTSPNTKRARALKPTGVVGGLDGIGRAMFERLTADPDWDLVALSRRKPDLGAEAHRPSGIARISEHRLQPGAR
jgi:hypothetical protein